MGDSALKEIHRGTPVLNVRICSGMPSGPESMVFPMSRAARRFGYEECAAYVHNAGGSDAAALRAQAAQWDCPLSLVAERNILDPTVLSRLEEICLKEGVRIWHSHDYKSNALGLLLRRRLDLQLVTTVHGWVHHTWKTPAYYALDRWCIRRYDRVIAVSEDLRDSCLSFGVMPDRLTLVENACADPGPIGAAERASSWPVTIGTLSRLAPEKGIDRLILAVSKLVSEGVDVRLLIAGDGPSRGRLERLAARTCPSQVDFCGRVPDAIQHLASLDIFAMPSLREGCPVSLLEAMALGRPVLATDVGGIGRVLGQGAFGQLIKPEDDMALLAGLRALIDDSERRRLLGAAARCQYLRAYTFEQRAQKVCQVYGSLEL